MKQIYKFCLTGILGSCMMLPSMGSDRSYTHFGMLKPTVTTRIGNTTHTETNRVVELHRHLGDSMTQGMERSFGCHVPIKLNKGWKAPAANLMITLDFPAEEAACFVQAVGFMAEDGNQYWAMQEEEDGPIFTELPAGKYVVTGFFAICNPEPDEWGQYAQTGSAMVVKENVEFSADSVFAIDGREAENFITASPIGPRGEEYELPKLVVGTGENGEPDIVDEISGNASNIAQRMGLYHKTYGELFWSQISMGSQFVSDEFPEYQEPSLSEVAGVYVNDFSEDIIVVASLQITPSTGVPNMAVAMQEGSTPGVLKPNPQGYTYLQTKYEQSELGKGRPFPPIEDPWLINMTNYFGDKASEGMAMESGVDLSLINYCATLASDLDFACGATAAYSDYTINFECDTIYEDEWMYVSEWRTSTSAVCPEVYIKDGKKTILNKTESQFYNMASAPTNPLSSVPSLFKYASYQQLQPYGRTSGYINTVITSAIDGDKAEIVPFYPQYVGYAGDMLAGVNALIDSDPTITYNGELVDYDAEYYSDFWSGGFFGWCYDWNNENHPAGAYTMDFESLNNIDGVEGKVKYSVAFDQTKSDCVPPIVQYLQFRDKEDCLTCIFGEGLQGDLYIGAGDFKADAGGVLSECVDGVVPIVSYAPYGTDEWTEFALEMVEGASGCFAPIFKGSLLQVDEESSNGWFDLKIEMTDAEGNSMSQMSSPAFCITSLSEVTNIGKEQLPIRVAGRYVAATGNHIDVYSIWGVKVASSSGNDVDLSDLPAGVYIIRSGNSSLKTILK